jgi:hypothetical protein
MPKKATRLTAPRFAIANKSLDNNHQADIENEVEENLNSFSQEPIGENHSRLPVGKVEYVRITTQVVSKIDRQLEYARVMLGKKKQDLINDLLSDGLKNLGITFPQL